MTVTDYNSCWITRTVTITQPPAALSATTTQVNVLCYGNSTGSATVNASNGTSPYTYLWSTIPSQAMATATGLSAGTYTVTVSDYNSCWITRTVTISQPSAALSATTTQVNVLCYGNSTGSATVNASNGTSP